MTDNLVVVVADDEKVMQVNKKACKIFGYSKDEIIGKNWFDNFIPDR
jgi:two-component system, sensor histidine kinase and response regulator